MSCSERRRELRRRRKRHEKVSKLKARAAKASVSEKAVIASKLRNLTPGAETIIADLDLVER